MEPIKPKMDLETLNKNLAQRVPDEGVPEVNKSDVPIAPKGASDSGEDDDLLGRALVGLAPVLLGAAIGGAEGGGIGAQAGNSGLSALDKARELDEKKKKEKEAAELEKRKQSAQERLIGLKEQALELQLANSKGKKQEKQDKFVSDLRKERNNLPTTKETQGLSVAYNKVKVNAENPSPAGDISLIFGFMKMIDPRSTVREGEFATAQNAGNIPTTLLAAYNKAVNGEMLEDTQRQDFLQQAQNLWSAQKSIQDQVDLQYARLATLGGIDPSTVIVSYDPDTAMAGASPNKKRTSTPSKNSTEQKTLAGKILDNLSTPEANASQKPMIPDSNSLNQMSDDEIDALLEATQ